MVACGPIFNKKFRLWKINNKGAQVSKDLAPLRKKVTESFLQRLTFLRFGMLGTGLEPAPPCGEISSPNLVSHFTEYDLTSCRTTYHNAKNKITINHVNYPRIMRCTGPKLDRKISIPLPVEWHPKGLNWKLLQLNWLDGGSIKLILPPSNQFKSGALNQSFRASLNRKG